MEPITIPLYPQLFEQQEKQLLAWGGLSASAFTFTSGVQAVVFNNHHGSIVLLPYQGQQIWSAQFLGRSLAMKSMFAEPQPTDQYLATYGGFMLHCGVTAIGNPGPHDSHPLHGELPNAQYQSAYIAAGSDSGGAYLELGGCYRNAVGFTHGYLAEPRIRLYQDATVLRISMTITNIRQQPMELMYMNHLNFRPIDSSRLIGSFINDSKHVAVRSSIPPHVKPSASYLAFLEDVRVNPAMASVLSPDLPLDPELVLMFKCLADEAGWAHHLQLRPDGYADYVKYKPEQLGQCVRWMVRTGDEEALGLALPSTNGPEGYTAEKAKGSIALLAGQHSVTYTIEAGLLAPAQAQEVLKKIEAMISKVN